MTHIHLPNKPQNTFYDSIDKMAEGEGIFGIINIGSIRAEMSHSEALFWSRVTFSGMMARAFNYNRLEEEIIKDEYTSNTIH